MERKIERICVYCGSSMGANAHYREMAIQLGTLLYAQGMELVYGGATCGMMGILADEVLRLGGKVYGIAPRFFESKNILHKGLTEFVYVENMNERKQCMVEMSDAFIALPGSYGTMDELFETLCLLQLKQMEKPLVLLNYQGFYDALLVQFKKMIDEGFLTLPNRNLLQVVENVEELLPCLCKKMYLCKN